MPRHVVQVTHHTCARKPPAVNRNIFIARHARQNTLLEDTRHSIGHSKTRAARKNNLKLIPKSTGFTTFNVDNPTGGGRDLFPRSDHSMNNLAPFTDQYHFVNIIARMSDQFGPLSVPLPEPQRKSFWWQALLLILLGLDHHTCSGDGWEDEDEVCAWNMNRFMHLRLLHLLPLVHFTPTLPQL